MDCAAMRNAERQHGAHVSSEKQQFIVKGDIEIIWTQSKGTVEIHGVKWKSISNE